MDMFEQIFKENWDNYETDEFPKDRRMSVLKHNGWIRMMITEPISFLINEIVRRCAEDGVYLEVGSFAGASLLSAALFNLTTRCIGMDNFSQFNGSRKEIEDNFAKFPQLKNIEFYEGDYVEVFKNLFAEEPDLKANVYFYNGIHNREDQRKGLGLMLPHLQDKCVIFVDDTNWPQVRKSNEEFIATNPEFKFKVRIRTKGNLPGPGGWHNGFDVMARGNFELGKE